MTSSRKRLVLIDGSSYLFRAFHALPPLTNAGGEPTGALFGVVNMLRATLKEQPDYTAFVSDASGPTFRDEMYPEYKANRAPTPDELKAQIEPMLAIVGALGFPILRVSGVEADDVIGTLAREAESLDIEVVISTGDKDFAQLVSPHISLFNTMTNTTLDRDGVIEKFGVPPERIVDFLALTGDTVDNVPGVHKCGPKTAAKWIAQYGSLDGVLESAEKITGKIGEYLREAVPHLPLSRQLVTIKTDVALDTGVTGLSLRDPDLDQLRELYRRYEFNAALKELESKTGASPQPESSSAATSAVGESGESRPASGLDPALHGPGTQEMIMDMERFQHWLELLVKADLIAFDTETTSLDSMRAQIVGISLAVEPKVAAYIPLAHDYAGAPAQLDPETILAALKPILENPDKAKLGQHAKYDMNVLSNAGITVRGLAHDTMLESYVLNSTASRHDMDTLARRHLGYETIPFETVAGKGAKQILFSQVDLET
ncbi:5'-3' exonuclease H3TH domain-containing protein, partial [Dokdonella sp.]|uniref:5'-3' exonuclease H3TH domain-containing protein n=1 Tax=Dokdonella sp. TaxID=2291710 RepID=UPI003C450510